MTDAERVDEQADGGPPAGVRMRVIGEARFWLQPRADYLYVRWAGLVADIATAEGWLSAIDEMLREHDLFRVLWEARPARVHPREVRDRIWEWLAKAEHLRVSSVVMHSEMLQVSVNLSRVASGVRLRAFDTVDAAERWLVQQAR